MVDFNKKEEKNTKNFKMVLIILGSIFALVGGIILAIMLVISSEKETKNKVATKKAETKKEINKNLDIKFAALFRQLYAEKICFDESHTAFLIYFPKSLGVRSNGESWGGWWFIEHPNFNVVNKNNTAFLFHIPEDSYKKVWPNVEGMDCADSKDYEGK